MKLALFLLVARAVSAFRISETRGVRGITANSTEPVDVCKLAQLDMAGGDVSSLRPRTGTVRLIDFIQFGDVHEVPLLYLRLQEMGDLVDEVHIAEADRFFTMKEKKLIIPDLLNTDPELARWKHKVVHHPIHIPERTEDDEHTSGFGNAFNVQDAAVQEIARFAKTFKGVMLEGDLDEIVSRPVLRALRACVPEKTGQWTAHVEMNTYKYNMNFTMGSWFWPTLVRELDGEGSNASFLSLNSRASAARADRSEYVITLPDGIQRTDGSPAGWHMTWMLDGADGMASKALNHIARGVPDIFRAVCPEPCTQRYLAHWMRENFIAAPNHYDTDVKPIHLEKKNLPEALNEDPVKFRHFLGQYD